MQADEARCKTDGVEAHPLLEKTSSAKRRTPRSRRPSRWCAGCRATYDRSCDFGMAGLVSLYA
jgi:hypothetical protein